MDNPLVSFLITNYNKGPWLAECLLSAFVQTYEPLEFILCEGGSTDNSLTIIKAFLSVPGFIPIICKDRVPITEALNKCLGRASGEWVVKLDADDVVSPEHIENMMADVLKNPSADIIFGDFSEVRNGETRNVPTDISFVLNKCTVGLCSAIIKKSIFKDIGGFDTELDFSEDWEFIIRAIRCGKKIVKGNKTGYIIRTVDDASMTKAGSSQSLLRINSHKYIREKHFLTDPNKEGFSMWGTIVITDQMIK